MSDKPLSMANGRVVFGMKELLMACGLIFTAGGGWWTLQAHGQGLTVLDAKVEAVETKVDADHESLIGITGDVERLVEDLTAIKLEQVESRKEATKTREAVQEQKGMLQQILTMMTPATRPR